MKLVKTEVSGYMFMLAFMTYELFTQMLNQAARSVHKG